MSASKRRWLVLGALVAPVVALAAADAQATAKPASTQAKAWRADPLAAGKLAVRPGDHVVTGRIASVTGREVVVASDLGGNEKLLLPPGRAAGLHSGELVTASYHVQGPALEVDVLLPGDLSTATRSSAIAAPGTGS